MKYFPEPVPYTDDLPYIREWLGREFSNILVAFEGVEMIELVREHITPTAPREGMIKFADGTNWDPGGGIGFYGYNGTSWVKLDDTSLSTGIITGTWTPVLTFATPGNLSVVYGNQQGRWQKVGNRVHLDAIIDTTTFTHTTASGEFRITGIPFAAASIANMQWTGAGEMGNGWTWPAGYTQMHANMTAGSSFVRFVAAGSGVNRVALTAANIATGSVVSTRIGITYETA